MERKRNSFGTFHHHKGAKFLINDVKYTVDYTREFFLFDIIPMGAPRMTQRDRIFTNPNHVDPKKRQRPAVTKYFEFKNLMQFQAKHMEFELGKFLDAVYFIPMPDTWSAKKKEKMNGMKHESSPDTDNITKAVKDTLRKNDKDIWWEKAQKRWAYKGSILIYN